MNIVNDRALRSRQSAGNFVDVANQGALNIFDGAHSAARLYFRPKNGFHFRTEGIKCIDDPYRLENHMSIPVMFVFDFASVITLPTAQFSCGNIQKSRVFLDGDDAFDELDFRAIYHDSALPADEKDYVMNMRMSEVSVLNQVPLDGYLSAIIFRTQSDLKTFRYLADKRGIECPYRVGVEQIKHSLFLSRGFFLTDISFLDGDLSLSFSFPIDFTPNNREFKIFAEQRAEGRRSFFDQKVALRGPLLRVNNYIKADGIWKIKLEDQLAFRGFLPNNPSTVY